MKLSLNVTVPGPRQGDVIRIRRTSFLIGRGPECHMRPASQQVSHQHCRIEIRKNRAFIHDLGSTNGTFVNGRTVENEVELFQGDQISVGPLEFVVMIEAEANSLLSDDDVAGLLLSLDRDVTDRILACSASDVVPKGDTTPTKPAAVESPPSPNRRLPQPQFDGDTKAAATAILQFIRRRPR